MRPPASSLLLLVALHPACTLTATVGVVEAETETTVGTMDDGHPPGTGGPLPDLGNNGGLDCTDRGEQMGVGPCMPHDPRELRGHPALGLDGPDGDTDSLVIPLVANLTDDDDDGRIDLCDKPDVLVVAGPPPTLPVRQDIPEARLFALDGVTGSLHWARQQRVRGSITPALADIDGDGEVEIVTLPRYRSDMAYPSHLVAFEADGSVAWNREETFDTPWADAVALADLDGDGDAELMVADHVFDHEGRLLFVADDVGRSGGEPLMPFGVDLDQDGDLEVLFAEAPTTTTVRTRSSCPRSNTATPTWPTSTRTNRRRIVVTSDKGVTILMPPANPG